MRRERPEAVAKPHVLERGEIPKGVRSLGDSLQSIRVAGVPEKAL